jgi:PAS domain S-box-containing protein
MESLPAVLIVDDDKIVLHTMQEQLARENYRVAAISSMAEALQRIRIERFGVIMADHFMPETSGLDFLRICRKTQPLSSRMIISGMAALPGIEEAIAQGDAFRVLVKPWTRVDLSLALTQATDRYRIMERLEATTRESRRQQNDLAALGRQAENYRQQLLSVPTQSALSPSAVEMEEIFRQGICHLDQAIWVSDAESHRILYLSPVHEDIWGRSFKELSGSGRFWVDTIHPDDRERVLKIALQEQRAGNFDEQYRILRPDGEVRWIRDRTFPIRNNQQKLYRIVGIVEDITGRKIASEQLEMRVRERTEELAWANLALESEISERRRAEIQLRETNQRLQAALEELHATQQQVIQQERLSALGKMAGGVAHDFNNALIPILGYAELLIERSELLDDRAVALKYLRLIRTAAKDATVVVSRLREFYRQRDETEIIESVDLVEALAEAISMTQPRWHDEALAQGRHITVEQEFQPVPMIACHGGEIREVVTNLIFNAVDALPQGGKIVVRAYAQEQNAVFEVSDDGVGMTEEVRVRCLEPFVTTKGQRGTGLGLAMVYGIVQRHHGAIEIESAIGGGSLVRVRLPFHRGVNVVLPAADSVVTRRLRILLLDDEQVVRDVISLFLRYEEHHVEVAETAIDALRLIREQKFDLVITDHAMPGMTGGSFVATLRSAGFDIPILMLTGFGEFMTTSESVPKGVTSLLNKPVTMEDLRSAIAAIFQDSKMSQRRD